MYEYIKEMIRKMLYRFGVPSRKIVWWRECTISATCFRRLVSFLAFFDIHIFCSFVGPVLASMDDVYTKNDEG